MAKIRILLLVCLVSCTALGSVSFAAIGPYVSAQVGESRNTWPGDTFDIESSFDRGFYVGASGGYDFGPARMELEFAYRKDKVNQAIGGVTEDAGLHSRSLMVNGFWDIETQTRFTPYLGGGVGVTRVSLDQVRLVSIATVSDDDTVLAYQLGAGVALELTPNLALDLGYRYFASSDPDFTDNLGNSTNFAYECHNVALGLRYMF